MRKWIYAVLISLLAGSASAQMTGSGPGMSNTMLSSGSITGQTNATGAVFTGATPFCFEGATDNAFETCLAINDPTGSDKTITIPDLSGLVLLGGVTNAFSTTAFNVTGSFGLSTTTTATITAGTDATINAAGVFTVDVGSTTMSLDDTNAFQLFPFDGVNYGEVYFKPTNGNAITGGWQSQAGFDAGITSHGGQGTSGAPAEVILTIADTNGSINAGTVTICGGIDANSWDGACETEDISAGAGVYTTTAVFSNFTVTFSGVSVLDGDEKYTISFTANPYPPTDFYLLKDLNTQYQFTMSSINNWGEPKTIYCPTACTMDLPDPTSNFAGSNAQWIQTYTVGATSAPVTLASTAFAQGYQQIPPFVGAPLLSTPLVAGDYIVIDDGITPETYTVSAAPALDREILVGATDIETYQHLMCAINDDSTNCAEGVDYVAAAASPLVRGLITQAVASGTFNGYGNAVYIARTAGVAGNSITVDVCRSGGSPCHGAQPLWGGAASTLADTVPTLVAGDTVSLVWEDDAATWQVIGISQPVPTYASSIVFEGSVDDAYETTLTVTNPTSSDKTITLPNATGTVPLIGSSNNNLTTTPFNFYGAGTSPGYASWLLNDTDGASWDTYPEAMTTFIGASNFRVDVNKTGDGIGNHSALRVTPGIVDEDSTYANSGVYIGLAAGEERRLYDFLINGGYVLDGMSLTSAVADEVDIVTADPGAGSVITSFVVQVCGYRNDYDKGALRTFCENVVAATPPETLTTTQTFIEITYIKTNTYVYSGAPNAITDETIAVAWDADATSVLEPILQVDHPASDFTGGVISLTYTNYWHPFCYDNAGCTVELGQNTAAPNGGPAREGVPMFIVGALGTEDITFTDDAEQQLAGAASFVMQENDTLQLLFALRNLAWVEISRSDN